MLRCCYCTPAPFPSLNTEKKEDLLVRVWKAPLPSLFSGNWTNIDGRALACIAVSDLVALIPVQRILNFDILNSTAALESTYFPSDLPTVLAHPHRSVSHAIFVHHHTTTKSKSDTDASRNKMFVFLVVGIEVTFIHSCAASVLDLSNH